MINIIGNGDIASILPEQDKFLFFASGVADSSELRESEYQREIDLLFEQDRNEHIVYFSTLSIFFKDTRYTKHKKMMETLIKENFKHYTIMRLGNPVWGKNKKHLINFFKDKISKGEEFPIYDEYRHVLSKEEFLYWVEIIPEWSCELNVVGNRMKVQDIVKLIKDKKI